MSEVMKRLKKAVLSLLLTLSLVVSSSLLSIGIGGTAIVHAQNEEIRVALFVDNGEQVGYRQTVPFVTISSNSGLDLYGSQGYFENANNASELRVAIDHYSLLMAQTTQGAEARTVSQQLAQQGIASTITQHVQGGQVLYRVLAGSEGSLTAIQQTNQTIQSKTGRSGQVRGPFHVQAGAYAGFAQAEQRLLEIQAQGFVGYVAQVPTGQGISYQVWIGDEPDSQAQSALLSQLQSIFAGQAFQAAGGGSYLLAGQASMFGAGTSSIPFYLVSSAERLSILPQAGSGVPVLKVEERENRSYRGKIEIVAHQQKMAVVNVLPLEQYLYSVVGTEMATGWPLEALKAQAVMSRNYAYLHLQQQKYGVAHVSDTVSEQAYYGFDKEADDVRQAVDATHGEYLTYRGNVFSTFYSSNAGGHTAQGAEVWGNPVETHSSVPSMDNYPETQQATWYRIQDKVGKIGYVIETYIDRTGQVSATGFALGKVNTPSLNYRSGPSTEHELIGSLQMGEEVTIIEEVKQNNAYSWIAGPYTGAQIAQMVSQRAQAGTSPMLTKPVKSLAVVERGPSGRVVRLVADGQVVHTGSPDGLRSVFHDGTRSLRSTLFEVEEMGEYVLMAGGNVLLSFPDQTGSGSFLTALGAGGQIGSVNGNQEQFIALGSQGSLRVLSKQPAFRFLGRGFGHGLGASQWGIYEMARQGYNYQQILQHYFHKDSVVERR